MIFKCPEHGGALYPKKNGEVVCVEPGCDYKHPSITSFNYQSAEFNIDTASRRELQEYIFATIPLNLRKKYITKLGQMRIKPLRMVADVTKEYAEAKENAER